MDFFKENAISHAKSAEKKTISGIRKTSADVEQKTEIAITTTKKKSLRIGQTSG